MLGLVQQAVGRRDEGGGAGRLAAGCAREGGDAEAGRCPDVLYQAVAQTFGQAHAASQVRFGQDQQELLAAVAHHAVDATARGVAEQGGKGAQHGIACGMAVGVVDALEVVEIAQDGRQAQAMAL